MHEQDVLGLEILVYDAHAVHVAYRLQALSSHRGDPPLGQVHPPTRLCLDHLMEFAPSSTLHDEVYVLVILVVFIKPNDVGVITSLQVLDLVLELLWRHLRQPLVDGLQDTGHPRPLVAHKVRHAKGAFSQLLHGLISEARPPGALLDSACPSGTSVLRRRLKLRLLRCAHLRRLGGRPHAQVGIAREQRAGLHAPPARAATSPRSPAARSAFRSDTLHRCPTATAPGPMPSHMA
mmetsp:Transcript_98104/g.218822  ORF Transcript_98104/g.218822 Transcript_98104/m.218822 type:complete len:235 (+) Transcript_98104:1595-2299(+)